MRATKRWRDRITHEAWGLGIYSVFQHPGVVLSRAIEIPRNLNVRFHDMITVCLGDSGEITNVINNAGGATAIHPRVDAKVTDYPQTTDASYLAYQPALPSSTDGGTRLA